ncbi:hypothetical protein B0H16DRAFT_1729803 [Mycena metata]|uniref:Uncharacterized protein n=1 Tax=Mycena metata TaxID=1033252 RepID=A0AAD7IAB9_9AGAR|nr:hypothetical protein B0H16DRAFT_1729803 [Mycena metata]
MAHIETLYPPRPCSVVCDATPKFTFKTRGDPLTFLGVNRSALVSIAFHIPKFTPESIPLPSALALNRESCSELHHLFSQPFKTPRVRILLFYDNLDAQCVNAGLYIIHELPPLTLNSERLSELHHLLAQPLKAHASSALGLSHTFAFCSLTTTTTTFTSMTTNCLQPVVLECTSLLNRCTTGTFLALLIALIVLVVLRFGRPTSSSKSGIGFVCAAEGSLSAKRSLPPLARVAALAEFRDPDPYVKEGPGALYVVALAANDTVEQYRCGLITAHDFLAQLRVKVGHAHNLPVRRRRYRKCDVGQTHFWLYCFHPEKRIAAGKFFYLIFNPFDLSLEQMCHMDFLAANAPRAILHCARGCGKHHKEYWWLKELGGFPKVEERLFFSVCAQLLTFRSEDLDDGWLLSLV